MGRSNGNRSVPFFLLVSVYLWDRVSISSFRWSILMFLNTVGRKGTKFVWREISGLTSTISFGLNATLIDVVSPDSSRLRALITRKGPLTFSRVLYNCQRKRIAFDRSRHISQIGSTWIGFDEMFCTRTLRLSSCPMEAEPKSIIVRPKSDTTIISGRTTGQWIWINNVFATLEHRWSLASDSIDDRTHS